MSDTPELFERWLVGVASEEEVARLDALVRADPAARRALFLAAHQDASVREALGGPETGGPEDGGSPDDGREGTGRRGETDSSRTRAARRARPGPERAPAHAAWVLVAALALLLGLALLSRTSPDAREPGVVTSLAPPSPPAASPPTGPRTPSPTSPAPTPEPTPAPTADASPEPSPEPPTPTPATPTPAPSLAASPLPGPAPTLAPSPGTVEAAAPAELPIVALEGALEVRREGKLVALAPRPTAAAPWTWRASEPLVAKGPARVTLASGTRLTLRTGAEVEAAGERTAPGVALAQGVVFCEVPKDPTTGGFFVKVSPGEFRSAGTEFAVASGHSGTFLLSVVEGAVEARSASSRRRAAAGESLELRPGQAPGSPRRADLAALAWRFELDAEAAALPRGSRVLFREDFSGETGWGGTRAAPPRATPRGLALGSVAATPERQPDFFAQVESARNGAGYAVSSHTYLRFRYLLESFAPRDHLKISFKDKGGMNYGGFLCDLVRDRWTLMTVKVSGAPSVDDRTTPFPSGEALHQIVWLGRTDAPPAPAGARFWLDDVVLFEAPGEVAADPILLHPQ